MNPRRLLIVMPSWVGDAVMATPALRLLRSSLPGIFIGGLVRPGIDQILAGSDFFDEIHADRPVGVMGYKHIAGRLRSRRYDTALLLTNSFSTALITRLAGVPRRVGYNRDARGLLLTDLLDAPRSASGGWAPIPAVAYYWHAARYLLDPSSLRCPDLALPPDIKPLELQVTAAERSAADEMLKRAELASQDNFIILNPGGNNPAKRWPADRFCALARELHRRHQLRILVNGSPTEAELVRQISAAIGPAAAALPDLGITLGSLKALLSAQQCRLMVTNDTGPRHLAAAFGTPIISLFGPTDHRWTTLPVPPGSEVVLLADPSLPPGEFAEDHPERCRIDRIELSAVVEAAEHFLAR